MSTEHFQLVILLIDDRLYAIDSEHFLEVIRGAVATPVPFVPAYIEGLVNVEGKIATQIDLGRLLSKRDTASAGQELAFIKTGRSLCALRVQQVIAILDAQDITIEHFADQQGDGEKPAAPCVVGEFVHDGKSILLLDHRAIGLLVQARAMTEGSGGLAGRVRVRDDESASGDTNHYLVVFAGQERFGFAINRITELVKSGRCTPIPGAPDMVSGLTLVRGQPVLTSRLQGLMNQHIEPGSDVEWIVLVQQGDLLVGIAVDRVVGIEEYEQSRIVMVNHPDSSVGGVVENDNGELTMLVDPASLLTGETVALLRRYMPSNRQDKTVDTQESKACLSVLIREELFAIPLDIVNRVIQYKSLESINDASQAILGAIDVDGRIVPVVNMHTGNRAAGRALADSTWTEYVIIESGKSEYAVRVNRTDRVIDLPVKNISRSKNTANPFAADVAQFESSIYSIFNHEHFDRIHTP